MVYLFIILFAPFAQAKPHFQLDDFLGPEDPAYFQALAPRLSKWVTEELPARISPASTTSTQRLIHEMAGDLKSWAFDPIPGRRWGRLQFSVRLHNGKQGEVTLSLFPEDSQKLRDRISSLEDLPLFSASERNRIIGLGLKMPSHEVIIYHKEGGQEELVATTYRHRQEIRRQIYRASESAVDSTFSLSPLVDTWATWSEDSKVVATDMTFQRLNPRWLGGAATPLTYRIGNEFLLGSLRIIWKSADDYELVYP